MRIVRGLARILILVGGLVAVAAVLAGLLLDLRTLHYSFGWPGVAAGVVLAPLTLMVEPWRALFSVQHEWLNLTLGIGGVMAGSALYCIGHLFAQNAQKNGPVL